MKHPPVVFAVGWNACINCGACVAVCPQPAGFTSPHDTIAVGEVCDIACMACEEICPVFTISHAPAVGLEVEGGRLRGPSSPPPVS